MLALMYSVILFLSSYILLMSAHILAGKSKQTNSSDKKREKMNGVPVII